MGKKISDFAAVSLLMLVMASFFFWGCSGNNPAGDASPSLRAGSTADDPGFFGTSTDITKDIDIDPPELPDIEGGKYADTAYAAHLVFNDSKNVRLETAASVIGSNGGILSVEIDGQSIDFYFPPLSVGAETSINIVVQKGKNQWNEDLYMFYFGPDGLEFGNYPILKMPVNPYNNERSGLSYSLYRWGGGSWFRYYSSMSNPQGILQFFIPQFSTYALLVRNPFVTGSHDKEM